MTFRRHLVRAQLGRNNVSMLCMAVYANYTRKIDHAVIMVIDTSSSTLEKLNRSQKLGPQSATLAVGILHIVHDQGYDKGVPFKEAFCGSGSGSLARARVTSLFLARP